MTLSSGVTATSSVPAPAVTSPLPPPKVVSSVPAPAGTARSSSRSTRSPRAVRLAVMPDLPKGCHSTGGPTGRGAVGRPSVHVSDDHNPVPVGRSGRFHVLHTLGLSGRQTHHPVGNRRIRWPFPARVTIVLCHGRCRADLARSEVTRYPLGRTGTEPLPIGPRGRTNFSPGRADRPRPGNTAPPVRNSPGPPAGLVIHPNAAT